MQYRSIAILLCIFVALPNAMFAQDQEDKSTRLEPATALILSSAWPGLGQFYNGPSEEKKGTAMAVIHGGLAVVTLIGALNPTEKETDLGFGVVFVEEEISPLFWAGFIGLSVNMIYSAYDAATRASEINRERGLGKRLAPQKGVRFAISPAVFEGRRVGAVAQMQVTF